jgi:hypothetical protein
MTIALTLIGAMLFPVASLFLLLWLTRLEETLQDDVEAARRSPAPAPILAIPVRGSEAVAPVVPALTPALSPARTPVVAPAVTLPGQRPAPVIELVPGQREASAVLSLGGSTNL